MKVVTIIQARTTSRRLPNKVLLDIQGKSLLQRVIEKSMEISNSDVVWVATSTHPNDEAVEMVCNRMGVNCFRGDLDNVRSRFHEISKREKADILVRVTADNPLTEPQYAEELINLLKEDDQLDYAKMNRESILDGTGSEVFTASSLEKSVREYDTELDREHVTASILGKMGVAEITSSKKALVAEKPYFVGVDTFEHYLNSCRLFEKYGEEHTLEQIIQTLNNNGRVI